MTDRTCTVDGCDRPMLARTYCNAHYKQWSKGRPFTQPKTQFYRAPGEDLRTYVQKRTRQLANGCEEWTGATDTSGYGVISVAGRQARVHRWAFEEIHGCIPEGALIDHTCWNRVCINPDHLRLANKSQNGSNRVAARDGSATGVRNVYPAGDRYQVRIMRDQVLHNFGTYDSLPEAAHVAEAGRLRLFGEYAGQG